MRLLSIAALTLLTLANIFAVDITDDSVRTLKYKIENLEPGHPETFILIARGHRYLYQLFYRMTGSTQEIVLYNCDDGSKNRVELNVFKDKTASITIKDVTRWQAWDAIPTRTTVIYVIKPSISKVDKPYNMQVVIDTYGQPVFTLPSVLSQANPG